MGQEYQRGCLSSSSDILDLRQVPDLKEIHTITLYLGPQNQSEWIDYLIGLQPKRIIFNPGTENLDFFSKKKALRLNLKAFFT